MTMIIYYFSLYLFAFYSYIAYLVVVNILYVRYVSPSSLWLPKVCMPYALQTHKKYVTCIKVILHNILVVYMSLQHHRNPSKYETRAANRSESPKTAVTGECMVVTGSTKQTHSGYEESSRLKQFLFLSNKPE